MTGDNASYDRLRALAERQDAADERHRASVARQRADAARRSTGHFESADSRELADERDAAAEVRDRIADERDDIADVREAALDEREQELFAAVLEHERRDELIAGLRLALATRDSIGQAKGILMERFDISPDEAFDLLRLSSQRKNVKLHEVADCVAGTRRFDVPR